MKLYIHIRKNICEDIMYVYIYTHTHIYVVEGTGRKKD